MSRRRRTPSATTWPPGSARTSSASRPASRWPVSSTSRPATEAATPRRMTLRRGNPWIALSVLSLGLFMTLLDVTIVNVAIPQLVDSLGASLDEALWVLNAYVLVFGVCLITAGRLGDIYGPRNMFLAGTALFTLSSALCGLASSPGLLIAARSLQGVGAALLTPQPLAIVLPLFPPE